MITIISPAKGFNSFDYHDYNIIKKEDVSLPHFLENAKEIVGNLKSLDIDDICKLMKTNMDIGSLNYERYKDFKFDKNGIPAILAYEGMQYTAIKASDINRNELFYANDHIRILSGLYGILSPLDSIYPYRLEMATRLTINKTKNLYEYWNNHIFEKIKNDLKSHDDKIILNLASDEYSRVIKKYLDNESTFVTCSFKAIKNNKLTTHSTISKPARGKMVNYIIKNRADDIETIKNFNYDGFSFHSEIVSKNGKIIELIFVKNEYDSE
ncbi:MAG: peroxide stress protein YaaA [Peptostreptococcus porci]|nr:peroxide stress protein YaaA [Peptostreptococcus porci]